MGCIRQWDEGSLLLGHSQSPLSYGESSSLRVLGAASGPSRGLVGTIRPHWGARPSLRRLGSNIGLSSTLRTKWPLDGLMVHGPYTSVGLQ